MRILVLPKNLLVAGALALGVAAGFVLERGYEEVQVRQMAASDEAVVAALNKIILLPAELPTVATVTDTEKLAKEPFFQHAENGDKVIMYKESRRAYLFRPRDQKIIDMTVIAVQTPTEENVPVFQTNSP